jgi:hypothetical protein
VKDSTDQTFNADPVWKKTQNVKKEEAKPKPRYAVYNKDPDFFYDRQTGVMYSLRFEGSFDGRKLHVNAADLESFVGEIVAMLNRREEAEEFGRRQAEARKNEYLGD